MCYYGGGKLFKKITFWRFYVFLDMVRSESDGIVG